MNFLSLIGCVVIAIVYLQIYYIILHYNDIKAYVKKYKNFRYGIDIVPTYIDPSTSDYNDTIFANIKNKRRCVIENNYYTIVSSNGYAASTNLNQKITYPDLLSCIIDMTENYNNMALVNPCITNQYSAACVAMNNLLN